jgi:hypothetical protein
MKSFINNWGESSAYSANIDEKLYEKITRLANSELTDAFFSKKNLDFIQNELVKTVNYMLKRSNPKTKCSISRQSDREVMLLMIEFYRYHQQMLSTASNFYIGDKSSVYNQVPVPAAFLFSDPSDSYIPGWFHNDKDLDNGPAKEGRGNNTLDTFQQIKKYNTNTIPQRCVGNKKYWSDIPFYDPTKSIVEKIADLNKKFIEFLAPKIIYEIRNYLKFQYFENDPYACFVDYGSYETNIKNKGLSLSNYYTSNTEIYTPDYAKAKGNPENFPPLEKHLTNEYYNCAPPPRTLEKELINPQVKYGSTDILFPRAKFEKINKKRRENSYKHTNHKQIYVPNP